MRYWLLPGWLGQNPTQFAVPRSICWYNVMWHETSKPKYDNMNNNDIIALFIIWLLWYHYTYTHKYIMSYQYIVLYNYMISYMCIISYIILYRYIIWNLLFILDINIMILGKLASLNYSWQSKEGTYHALGMEGIEPTPSKSECDWTRFRLNHSAKVAVNIMILYRI